MDSELGSIFRIEKGAASPTVEARQTRPFRLKRLLDLALAVPALLLATPILALIVVLIKATSSGPALFVQDRVGKNGRRFRFYKLRTMYHCCDDKVHRDTVRDFIKGAKTFPVNENGMPLYVILDDQRITPVGRFLRKSSLDELPQLINVIKGDMSLVGPRPATPYEVAMYKEWHKDRLLVLPGITGLWQIQRRDTVAFDDLVRLDLRYIAEWSISLDLRILVLTIPVVLFSRAK